MMFAVVLLSAALAAAPARTLPVLTPELTQVLLEEPLSLQLALAQTKKTEVHHDAGWVILGTLAGGGFGTLAGALIGSWAHMQDVAPAALTGGILGGIGGFALGWHAGRYETTPGVTETSPPVETTSTSSSVAKGTIVALGVIAVVVVISVVAVIAIVIANGGFDLRAEPYAPPNRAPALMFAPVLRF
jgi:hypothetical protein